MPGTDGRMAARVMSRLVRRVQRTTLSVRLAVLSAALAAFVIFATFAALSVQIRNSTRELFAAELARSGRTLVALQQERRRRLVLTASLLAQNPNLNYAIDTYRVEAQSDSSQRADLTSTVQGVIERLGADLPRGTLLVTDDKGRVFAGYARGATRPMRGVDLSTLGAVRNALDPSLVTNADEPYLSGLEVDDLHFAVGVAPLIVHDYTIGTVVFGEPVDSTLVTSLRKQFDGDVVISAGTRVITSTLPAASAREVAEHVTRSGQTIALAGDDYLDETVQLGTTQRGTPLRMTLLQPLSPTLRALTHALLRDFLLYGLLAVVLAGFGAALVSRSLLRPLLGFIRFMRRGSEREHVDEHFDTSHATQEVRVLNESFHHLMTSLSGKRDELEAQSAQLLAANEVLTDEIQERERVEKALRDSELQLRQSQKLEAIGTLAGGVAHDFNNMLTVISGFTQLAMSRLGREHPVSDDLKQVYDAATSAASLTHQLLAFSRKQVLLPRVLDLECVVSGVESMLRRLIGPRIELTVTHEGEPARVKADPGQLEQVLLNLAVNARDAMPEGGTLVITTAHRKTGEREDILLIVRDSGTGMTSEVRDRVFEPFFTTKEVGKGTGLGLSTVYGIIVQSGGTIELESEVGRGTTFTVVLPSIAESVMAHIDGDMDGTLPSGSECVLLVDDEDAVLHLARRTLESCGYSVRVASSGVEALAIARGHEVIDLLVTDVMMPQLSGPQLVERYRLRRPDCPVIYMTGFVDDATTRLELDEDVTLLRKPFSPAALARTVRMVLDRRHTPAAIVKLG